ncbi:MAG: succinate dehydrogenase cytochrome b subunit [Acidimicrobiia bacterium]|nr:succinate dehydrogenase cytochrome b subunit [Acidimicrobiia bacterium]
MRVARLYDSTVGKKAVMAATGVLLFGFVITHLLGNLQFYLGPEALNAYGRNLRHLGALLWAARLGLLAAVLLHISAAVQLWRLNKQARPSHYEKLTAAGSSYASRTMMWSGPILALFIGYHLYHLTLGAHLLHDADGFPLVYQNVVAGFSDPLASGLYIVAMSFLGMHLMHGIWSMFQSIGWNHPKYTPLIKRIAVLTAALIVAGNISIPVAVLLFHQ